MSRASISTGGVLFDMSGKDTSSKKTAEPRKDGKAMHIALIGDFSGRGSRSIKETETICKRKAIEIDRDNFEEVFSSFGVKLQLAICDEPIHFREYDDLHPDYLFERVPLFEKLRMLRHKLRKPDQFQQAAEEIQQWASFKAQSSNAQKSEEEAGDVSGIPMPDNMLEAVLSQSNHAIDLANSPEGNIDRMIKDIVAPYVEAKSDPRLPEMEEALAQANSDTLRKVMHASAFQEIESNWRSVYMLICRLNTNRNLKLFIIDISRDEMRQDLAEADDITTTGLYKRLVSAYEVPGSTPFSILQFDAQINDKPEDIRLASGFAHLAQACSGIALASASERLAGCEGVYRREDTEDWQHTLEATFVEQWQALRQQASSRHLALAAPRFLLRLPYGKRSSPIESFDFEELSISNAHNYYLWGNSAYLVTLLLAQAYSETGWQLRPGQIQEVEDLPLHIYQDEDGESVAKACAEIFMRDSAAQKLAEAGILSIRSVKGKAAVVIPNFRTVALSGEQIFG